MVLVFALQHLVAPGEAAARAVDSDTSFWSSPGLSGPRLLDEVPAGERRSCGRYALYCPGCERTANSSIAYYAVAVEFGTTAQHNGGRVRTAPFPG